MANAYLHDHAYKLCSVHVPANGATLTLWSSDPERGTGKRWVFDFTVAGRRTLNATTSKAKADAFLGDVAEGIAAGTAVRV